MRINSCCFFDEEIKRFIDTNSKGEEYCSHCYVTSPSIDITELIDFFAGLISIYKKDSTGIALFDLIQRDWALFAGNGNEENLLNEIISLITSGWDANTKVSYIEEIIESVSYWDTLKDNLKTKMRFLTNASKLIEYEWDTFFNITSEITKNHKLYRARIHTDGSVDYLGLKSMGCPPLNKATGGRANPHGIPYLYLCEEPETTLYEARALYLDIVSVGTFMITGNDNLKIVDFTQTHISPFKSIDDIVRFTKGVLLRKKISTDLSKPMRRFDSELEYIPTQFICEFIKEITGADGIRFRSSIFKVGNNVVLFDPQKVECIKEDIHHVEQLTIESRIVSPTLLSFLY